MGTGEIIRKGTTEDESHLGSHGEQTSTPVVSAREYLGGRLVVTAMENLYVGKKIYED